MTHQELGDSEQAGGCTEVGRMGLGEKKRKTPDPIARCMLFRKRVGHIASFSGVDEVNCLALSKLCPGAKMSRFCWRPFFVKSLQTPELSLFCYRREYIFCAQRPTHGIVTLWQIEGDPVLFQTNVKLEGTAIGQIQEESHSRRIF
jgi:hypothetical protein